MGDTRNTSLRLEALTGLRFFAAFAVVIYHYTAVFGPVPVIGRYTDFGASGVSFFFVLSGFVLAWSARPDDTAGWFYWRRFARVWPLHFVAIGLALLVFAVLLGQHVAWWWIALTAVLLQAWVPSREVYFAPNSVSWSLSCEAFFYALFPCMFRLLRRLSLRQLSTLGCAVSASMLLAAVVVRAGLNADPEWPLYIFPGYRFGEFLIGVLAALAVRAGWRPRPRLGWCAVSVVAWVVLRYDVLPVLPGPLTNLVGLQYVVVLLLFAAVIVSATVAELHDGVAFLRHSWTVRLGVWSFALYLTHQPLLFLIARAIGRHEGSPWSVGILVPATAVCVAVAGAAHAWIEQPIERRLRSVWVLGRARRPVSLQHTGP